MIALAVWPAATASAGRLVATGHDVDDHCGSEGDGQCHFMKVATRYVRQGAPQPSERVLVLDCQGSATNAVDQAFNNSVPRKRMCPSADPGEFRSEPFTPERYSAIIVGTSCDDTSDDDSLNLTEDDVGGCDEPGGSTPDSDLINARSDDFKRYFNQGGGIFAMSGDENGDGDPSNGPDVYYDFLPLGAQGVEVNPPFCLTPVGIEIGFEDQDCPDPDRRSGTHNDINCCPTHNSFAEPPRDSALEVAERDSGRSTAGGTGRGFPETLVAEGRIGGGGFQDGDGSCRGRPADFVGDDGEDEITGTSGRDVIDGQGGQDTIRGRGGNDLICGKQGADHIFGKSGDDDVFGGGGARDKLTGGAGEDRLDGGKEKDILVGSGGEDRLLGTGGRDTLRGGDQDDVVVGGGGDDSLKGRSGDDTLGGGPGDDFLNGGAGFDSCSDGGGFDAFVSCET